jgi:propionyl-CoA carboxylase beta chain
MKIFANKMRNLSSASSNFN